MLNGDGGGRGGARSGRRGLIDLAALLFLIVALFSCSEEKSDPVRPAIQPNLLDAEFDVGYHCVCWDQYIDETLAAPGRYAVRIVAGSYDNTWNFWILSAAAHVRQSECCDSATISILKPLRDPPEFFGLSMDADTFRVSDTIFFEFAMPRVSRLQVEIRHVE